MSRYTETLDRFRKVSSAYRDAAVTFRRDGNIAVFIRARQWLAIAQKETDKAEDNSSTHGEDVYSGAW